MEMRNMYEMCFTKTILFHCIDLDCIFPYSLSFSLSIDDDVPLYSSSKSGGIKGSIYAKA